MITILEGPRGVGKTTLANNLLTDLTTKSIPARIEKFERADDPIAFMYEKLREMMNQPGIVHIVDRFHLTEFVMSTALQRYSNMKMFAARIWELDAFIEAMGIPVFILSGSRTLLNSRIEARNDGRGFELPDAVSEVLWRTASTVSRAKTLDIEKFYNYEDLVRTVRRESLLQLELV